MERSSRILILYERLLELELRLMITSPFSATRFLPLQASFCPRATVELAHSKQHYNRLLRTCALQEKELDSLQVEGDLYYGKHTFLAASLACGGVVNAVNAVLGGDDTTTSRAIALVRPPGHHATRDQAMGTFTALPLFSTASFL
jgi:acetoin utilization deacetylase AcuC-like enzyme